MPATELSREPLAAPRPRLISPLEILDHLAEEVVVLDGTGTIVWVNEEWRRFARANGAAEQRWEGVDYLGACQDRTAGDDEPDLLATDVRDGVRRVLAGEVAELRLEYPCHSPTEERWFLLAVRSLPASSTPPRSAGGLSAARRAARTAPAPSRARAARATSAASSGSSSRSPREGRPFRSPPWWDRLPRWEARPLPGGGEEGVISARRSADEPVSPDA